MWLTSTARSTGLVLALSTLISPSWAEQDAQYTLTKPSLSHTTFSQHHSNWTRAPSRDSTHHLIFQAASALLQHWDNAAYPNGHSIVPAVIPTGTRMYHGTGTGMIPMRADWMSFEPEYAMVFGVEPVPTLFSFITSRPMKVVYFDGDSAGLTRNGTFDTQYLIWKGEVVYKDGDLSEVWVRAVEMCEWGKQFGVDGFIRMEFNFEAIICDFSAFVQVSNTTIVPLPSDTIAQLEVNMRIGAWYKHYPGLPFVLPDYSRFITFFDTDLAPSLVPVRRKVENRRDLRLLGLSKEDTQRAKSRVEDLLSTMSVTGSGTSGGSGIQWQAILRGVKNRYATSLGKLNRTLASPTFDAITVSTMIKTSKSVSDQLEIMLQPYFASVAPTDANDHSGATPVHTLCSIALTDGLEVIPMTREEHVLRRAIDGTLGEICRVLVMSWVDISSLSSGDDSQRVKHREGSDVLSRVRGRVSGLVEWLGWPEWMACEPACDEEHFCWMPEWLPIIGGTVNSTTPECLPRPSSNTV